jgi:homoserine kinase
MFAAKTSIRNYVCRRTIHPRDVMSSSSSSVAAAASAGQHNRYLSKNMSSSPMMEASAEEESHFALILGKPGGGKGTISGKILKVRTRLLD